MQGFVERFLRLASAMQAFKTAVLNFAQRKYSLFAAATSVVSELIVTFVCVSSANRSAVFACAELIIAVVSITAVISVTLIEFVIFVSP